MRRSPGTGSPALGEPCYKTRDMAGPTALAANRRVATEASPAPFLYRAIRGPVRRALSRWFDLSIEGLGQGHFTLFVTQGKRFAKALQVVSRVASRRTEPVQDLNSARNLAQDCAA